jgi:high affinity sulfate transporter 1
MHLDRILPLLGQLRGYRAAWLRADLLAGLSVAAVALPTAIAYPAIMGLPPETGLYAAILPPVGYALFGPSRQLMVGPDTATSMMVASALLGLGVVGMDERIAMAAAFAVAVGIACVAAGSIGFGAIANFLSKPVLMGFLAGVALDLILGQLGKLTGLALTADQPVGQIIEIVTKLSTAHLPTLALGVALLVLLRILRRLAPRLPAPLVAVALGLLLSLALDLGGEGVRLVGAIPRALPQFALPVPKDLHPADFLLATLGILLVSFSSGIVTARSFGLKNRYAVDADRELIGFGAANIAAGLFSGFPVTSSDSRTAVNDAVGGKTQIAGLIAAAALTVVVLFFGNLLAFLPIAVLSAVLISAALDLIDTAGMAQLWRLSRIEFLFAVIGILSVLSFGVLRGVIIAVLATISHLIWVASQPRDALLGRIPGREGLFKLHRHRDAVPIPGLVIYLPEGSLVFFNADYVKRRLLKSVTQVPVPPEWLVLDASAIAHLDTTAVDALEDARASLAAKGIRLAIAELHKRPRQMIERSGLADRLEPGMIFHSAEDAADIFEARHSGGTIKEASSS